MTIAEVSKKYDISADTLRYYEREGLILPVPRTTGGIRNYTEESCRWIEFAKCMRAVGMPVEVLAEYVAMYQQGDATHEARKQLLIEQRSKIAAQIEEMQSILQRLDLKIERYEQWNQQNYYPNTKECELL